MARIISWRRSCPELVITRQKQALESKIYIIREIGPTGFLLKEEKQQRIHKVLIGDIHSCTCLTFLKSKLEICKHICWILLKKFKLSSSDPLSWQLGLCEREVTEMLKVSRNGNKSQISKNITDADLEMSGKAVKQRKITKEDACPICQEDFSDDSQGITYCRFGCGNSVHTKCMRIWAAHRKPDSIVECPFCRTDFGPITLLGEEKMRSLIGHRGFKAGQLEHRGIFCCACGACPILGKCYKCDRCDSEDFCLCTNCFKTEIHTEHPFVYRLKTNQKWNRVANRSLLLRLGLVALDDILTRDITEEDYEILLQLDDGLQNNMPLQSSSINIIQESHLNALPSKRLRDSDRLLVDRDGCKICSGAFHEGQEVKQIPCCKKWLHRECLEVWLLHWSQTCPFDGSELTEKTFTDFHKRREKVLNVDKSPRKIKQIGNGDGADISIHGSNVCPPELNVKSNVFPASHQAWLSHSAQHPVSKKHRNSKTAQLGKKIESSSKRRHPKYLPPLLSQDPLCIVAKHVDMTVNRQTSSKNLNRSKCFQFEDQILCGTKSAPTAKREHSWPSVSSQNFGRILLQPIADKHKWLTCHTPSESGDRDPMAFPERLRNSPWTPKDLEEPPTQEESLVLNQSEDLFTDFHLSDIDEISPNNFESDFHDVHDSS